MYNKPFFKLLTFFIAYIWFINFSKAVLPTQFLAQGLSLSQMMIGSFLGFAGSIILPLTIKKLSAKFAWRTALISWLVYLILIVTIHSPLQFYFASLVSGFTIYLFYAYYNTAHFEKTPQKDRGHGSAMLFSLPALTSILSPLLAGYVTQINVNLLWIISILSFLIAFYTIELQEDFTINFSLKAVLAELKATKTLLFIEGIWEALPFGIIPIYTLFFIKTPLNYGIFLSYISIISIVANLTLGKLTDKFQKRVIFLYPITILMALCTFMFPIAATNLTLWIIMVSAVQFILPLFWNVSTALVVDSHPNLKVAFPGREFVLAAGRIVGFLFCSISFAYEKSPSIIFVVLGLTLLCYPTVLYWNMYITKRYKYL